jgi:predicted nuclease of restriction endonuclease-like (RecB) superfamily
VCSSDLATVNVAMVYTYFEIGRMIFEEEQQGKERAGYGTKLLEGLSEKLSLEFGKGFSYSNLKSMRQFYLTYGNPPIRQTLSGESEKPLIGQTLSDQLITSKTGSAASAQFTLSWSHYLILIKIDNPDERKFYEIEALQNNWSVRTLERQYHSSLYERIALSKDKNKVKELATKGNKLEAPKDVIKSPLVLEFLGLEEKSNYSESDLESAIISKLKDFLLELGKGFLFEARQKRFSFDNENYYVDLVFYNRLLQCYVLIDLKTTKLSHQDLGQMQMYVNYFDRYVKTEFEKPTIGILLCKKKSDLLVELTLPDDANIYASEYSLYLPDKQLLQQKLTEWTEEFNQGREL